MVAAWGLAILMYFPSLNASLSSDDYRAANQVGQVSSFWSIFTQAEMNMFYRPVYKAILYLVGIHILPLRILSVIFHCAAVAVVILAGKEIFESIPGLEKASTIGGGVAGLIFAVFPRQNETVVWIASINQLLTAICFWGAVIIVIRYLRSPQPRRLVILFFLMVAGFLTKENMAAFPAVAAVIVFYYSYKNPSASRLPA